jgi:hypothetical protein
MRWSLIALVLLSLVCFSLAVPVTDDESSQPAVLRVQPDRKGKAEGIAATKEIMEAEASKWLTRTAVVREDSKVYRENAKAHGYAYTLDGDSKTGTVNQAELETAEKRKAHGEKMIATKGVHAGMYVVSRS